MTNEYNVLGYRVRLQTHSRSGELSAEDIISRVQQEAELIKENKPGLEKGQLAILVALKLASDQLELEQEFKRSIDHIQSQAKDALEQIDQLS